MNFSSKGTHPFSPSSSSSSSSSCQKILVPFSFHQSQLQPQQRSWLSSSSTTNNGTELLLMDNPPSPNHCDGDPDSENHHQLDLGVGVRSTANLIEKEHMFDKVVTPSDVGKLNRLVIPKQHAEKYFPLDSSTNEKGLLLNFEDRNGKPWRFRYSYWNSSQSYVMTKGWSRFVKEKKLDAGDVVSFQRGAGEFGKDRLFIDWRRRPDAPVDHFTHLPLSSHHFHLPSTSVHYPAALSHPTFLQPPPPPPDHSHFHSRLQPQHSYMSAYNSPNYYHITTNSFSDMSTTAVVNGNPCPSGPVIYLRSGAAAQAPSLLQIQRGAGNSFGGSGRLAVEPMVFDSVPVIQGKAAAKRLRLFGVNMDCPISESDEICDMLSSSSLPTAVATASTYSHAPQFSSSSTSSIPNAPQFRTFNNYELQSAAAEEESSDKGCCSCHCWCCFVGHARQGTASELFQSCYKGISYNNISSRSTYLATYHHQLLRGLLLSLLKMLLVMDIVLFLCISFSNFSFLSVTCHRYLLLVASSCQDSAATLSVLKLLFRLSLVVLRFFVSNPKS